MSELLPLALFVQFLLAFLLAVFFPLLISALALPTTSDSLPRMFRLPCPGA